MKLENAVTVICGLEKHFYIPTNCHSANTEELARCERGIELLCCSLYEDNPTTHLDESYIFFTNFNAYINKGYSK